MIHKHKPVDVSEMDYNSHRHTICQVLREIYRTTGNEDIRLKCRVGVAMAKAMSAKLEEYKKGTMDELWGRQ